MQVGQKKILIKLMQNSVNLCNNYNIHQSLLGQCHFHKIHQLLSQLDLSALGVEKEVKNITNSIGIWTIMEQFPLRISLYYLPKGYTMKLHDHPKMEVISYLIKGKMKATLFSRKHGDIYEKKTTFISPGQYSFIEGQKSEKDNLHEFHGVQPTFFMDIMFPDYDAYRPCTFFDEVEQINENTSRLKADPYHQVSFSSLR